MLAIKASSPPTPAQRRTFFELVRALRLDIDLSDDATGEWTGMAIRLMQSEVEWTRRHGVRSDK